MGGASTTYTDAHSGDSSKSAKLSRDVPRVASLRLAAADILDASGPPLGCLRLRSCTRQIILATDSETCIARSANVLLVHCSKPHWQG